MNWNGLKTNHRKSIFVILLTLDSVGVLHQGNVAGPANAVPAWNDCLTEWYALFKERGAGPIGEGTHEVIITLQRTDYSEFFMGKIDVADGKLAGKLHIQKMNGTYKEFYRRVISGYWRCVEE